MPQGIGQAYANELLDHSFKKAESTQPTNVYIALLTAACDATDTGSTITEADYTGYARVEIEAADMDAASGGSINSAATIAFGKCTAGSDHIVGIAILNASTGGTLMFFVCNGESESLFDEFDVNTTYNRPEIAADALSVAFS